MGNNVYTLGWLMSYWSLPYQLVTSQPAGRCLALDKVYILVASDLTQLCQIGVALDATYGLVNYLSVVEILKR